MLGQVMGGFIFLVCIIAVFGPMAWYFGGGEIFHSLMAHRRLVRAQRLEKLALQVRLAEAADAHRRVRQCGQECTCNEGAGHDQ